MKLHRLIFKLLKVHNRLFLWLFDIIAGSFGRPLISKYFQLAFKNASEKTYTILIISIEYIHEFKRPTRFWSSVYMSLKDLHDSDHQYTWIQKTYTILIISIYEFKRPTRFWSSVYMSSKDLHDSDHQYTWVQKTYMILISV